jgi:2-(1,2-epoxy-1,2-dihydrophenyl)acetyl-CoA isomerase
MTELETLLVERDGGVQTITLNRPDALNSFNAAMKRELLEVLKVAARDNAVRCLILTGAGRAFSAGQDLKERQAPGAADLAQELREHYNPIVRGLRRLEKPVIAAVNGVAAGAGCSLAIACDIVIASENAKFIEVFANVGLIPDTGSTWFLPRLVGYARAAEMVFTAEPVDAATAERIGLINRVVPSEQLIYEARALAQRLSAAPPLALALAKRALNRALESDLDSALDHEAQLQGIAGRSQDHAEGIAAFVEKRPPRFTGE